MEREQIESIIESLLFVAGEPVSLKRMCEIVNEAERAEVQAALDGIVRRCEAADRGLRVLEVAGGYQLQTASENSPWVGRLLQSRPIRLSRASLETLAIVAYKQPVTRAEIDEVRGVDSGGTLKTLLEYGFLRIAGRKDVPGKPIIYATDKRFLEFFRMKSLSELPTLREMEEIQEEQLAESIRQGTLPLDESAETGELDPAAGEGAEPDGEGAGEATDPGPDDSPEPAAAPGVETEDEPELDPGDDPGAEFDPEGTPE
jgi:segregation and condensation protein B